MEEFLSLFLSLYPRALPPAFGYSPANVSTHHGMQGIVQQMPLRRTFLSGTTPLFTLFILKYLSPALIVLKHATRPFFSMKKTYSVLFAFNTEETYSLLKKKEAELEKTMFL